MPFPAYEARLLSPNVDWQITYGIQKRSYELWEQAGRPEGMQSESRFWAEHFWTMAEAEIKGSLINLDVRGREHGSPVY